MGAKHNKKFLASDILACEIATTICGPCPEQSLNRGLIPYDTLTLRDGDGVDVDVDDAGGLRHIHRKWPLRRIPTLHECFSRLGGSLLQKKVNFKLWTRTCN